MMPAMTLTDKEHDRTTLKGEIEMKKLTKLLAVSITGGLLLAGCMDAEDVDENDLPAVEEPADPADPADPGDDPMDEDMEDDAGVMEDDPADEELDDDNNE